MFIRRLYEYRRSGCLQQGRLPQERLPQERLLDHAQRQEKNLRTILCRIANWSNTRESGASMCYQRGHINDVM